MLDRAARGTKGFEKMDVAGLKNFRAEKIEYDGIQYIITFRFTATIPRETPGQEDRIYLPPHSPKVERVLVEITSSENSVATEYTSRDRNTEREIKITVKNRVTKFLVNTLVYTELMKEKETLKLWGEYLIPLSNYDAAESLFYLNQVQFLKSQLELINNKIREHKKRYNELVSEWKRAARPAEDIYKDAEEVYNNIVQEATTAEQLYNEIVEIVKRAGIKMPTLPEPRTEHYVFHPAVWVEKYGDYIIRTQKQAALSRLSLENMSINELEKRKSEVLRKYLEKALKETRNELKELVNICNKIIEARRTGKVEEARNYAVYARTLVKSISLTLERIAQEYENEVKNITIEIEKRREQAAREAVKVNTLRGIEKAGETVKEISESGETENVYNKFIETTLKTIEKYQVV
ncbi:MAG: hypothetical protein RMI04_09380 [Thermofilaceae archaeon]|nr:hypothetical protein [Thermofilaceae archaeon]